MGLTGSKEAEPTQTVDELIHDWQANPDIKKLEHFMGKLIEHMKHSYEELTDSKDVSVKNKEFCRKFQIFVKSEIVSYVDRGILTDYFKPYLKNKTISRKNIGIGVCKEPINPDSNICTAIANYYTKRLNIALAVGEATRICNDKYARLEERLICYSDQVSDQKINPDEFKETPLEEINVSPILIRNQAIGKLTSSVGDNGRFDEVKIRDHLLVGETVNTRGACQEHKGFWGARDFKKVSKYVKESYEKYQKSLRELKEELSKIEEVEVETKEKDDDSTDSDEEKKQKESYRELKFKPRPNVSQEELEKIQERVKTIIIDMLSEADTCFFTIVHEKFVMEEKYEKLLQERKKAAEQIGEGINSDENEKKIQQLNEEIAELSYIDRNESHAHPDPKKNQEKYHGEQTKSEGKKERDKDDDDEKKRSFLGEVVHEAAKDGKDLVHDVVGSSKKLGSSVKSEIHSLHTSETSQSDESGKSGESSQSSESVETSQSSESDESGESEETSQSGESGETSKESETSTQPETQASETVPFFDEDESDESDESNNYEIPTPNNAPPNM